MSATLFRTALRHAAFVMLVAICTAVSGFAGDITTGLVAYYKLDENGGLTATDLSGNNNHGALMNFPTNPWVAGPVNGALQFDGINDRVLVPDAANLRMPGDFTVAFWVRKTFEPVNWTYIIGKGSNYPQRNYSFWDFPGNDGRIHFSINDTLGNQPHTVDSVTNLVPNQWYHVVGVRLAGTTYLYINGVLDISKVSAGPQFTNTTAGINFCTNEGGGEVYPGTLDDVRIYNRGLTAADVQSLFAFRDLPKVVSAMANTTTQIDLTFNTPVEVASANNAANYSLNGGVSVTSAVRQGDPKVVRLTVTAMQTEVIYTVSVANVRNENAPVFTMAPQQFNVLVNGRLLDGELLAHYQFEETAGTQADDSTGRNNHGTLMQAAARGAGKNGSLVQGLVLDGSTARVNVSTANYIDTPAAEPFRYVGGNISLSLWCNIDATEVNGGYLLSKPWNGNGEYNYWLYLRPDRRIDLRLQGATSFVLTTPGAISTGAWHHIVGTVDSARNMAIYVDGVLVTAPTVHTVVSWTTVNGNRNVPLCIGGLYPYDSNWGGDSTFCVDGTMDDVRVYNRILSAAEIAELAADKPIVSISATDTLANENGLDVGTFRISRTGSTANPLTVQLQSSGTATLGADYNLNNGAVTTSVVIPAGQAFVDVSVNGLNDPNGEPVETVILTIAASAGLYNRAQPVSATVNLNDDEAIVSVLALQPTASERGPQRGAFQINRTNNLAAQTVVYTVSGSALNGTDYQTLTLSVAFGSGQTFATVFVDPIGDALVEGNETVILTLSSAAGQYATPGADSGTVTIEDRSVVTLQASDPDAYEVGVNPGVITLTRTAPFDEALTVPYTVTGSAAPGTDYIALSGSAAFAVGESTTTITITPIDDALLGLDSIVTISITTNVEFAAGTPNSAAVTIHTDPEIFTGSGGITMTPNPALAGQQVAFSGAAGGAAVVSWLWAFGDGTTAAGQQATHTYTQPGEYEVTVSAGLADGTISTGKRLLFVGTAIDSSIPGSSAVAPGSGGLLVGGNGVTKQASGKLKIRFSRRQVTLSVKLGNLMFDDTLGQSSLQGRQGWLMLGPESNRKTYFFVLDPKGSGSNPDVPKMQISLKKRALSFTVVEPSLTEFLGTLGATRTAPAAVVNVPIAIRVADKIFVAFTLMLDFKARNDNGSGTLRKR